MTDKVKEKKLPDLKMNWDGLEMLEPMNKKRLMKRHELVNQLDFYDELLTVGKAIPHDHELVSYRRNDPSFRGLLNQVAQPSRPRRMENEAVEKTNQKASDLLVLDPVADPV